MGFKAGQEDQLRPQTQSPSLPHIFPPMHIKALVTNQTSAIASEGNTSIAFDLPATITNVYFSIYANVVGNNFTDVNPQLYDITECHKIVTATDLQPNAKCGISVLDARDISRIKGSVEHLRLPAGRNYVLLLTNPTDGPVQVRYTAYITYTYRHYSYHG